MINISPNGSGSSPPYRPGKVGLGFLSAVNRLPFPMVSLLGRIFGDLAYLVDKKRGRIVMTNLGLCFPHLDTPSARRLMHRHFIALSRATLCTIAITWHESGQQLQRRVRFKNREHYDRALAQGRNIILLAPHFIGLELGWMRLSQERQLVGMYREPRRNPFHWALHRNRTRFGGIAIERNAGLRPLIRMVREGMPFYYLPDLDPGQGRYVFAPFFGHPAATLTTVSRIARLANAVVIPCITRQVSGGCRYEIDFRPPLENFPSDDWVGDARQMNAMIEAEIRKTPEQYFWVHRRFKTRPDNAPSFYNIGSRK